jgi:hypothetical protein
MTTIEEIDELIIEKQKEIATYNALQQAFKIALNSLNRWGNVK